MNKFSILLILSLTLVSNSLYANTYTIASTARGWVNSAGEGNGSGSDNDTNVGNDPSDSGKSYISWAYFNLSPLIGAGTVTNVSLAGSFVPIEASDKPYIISAGGANISLNTLANINPGVDVYNQLKNGNGYSGPYVGLYTAAGDYYTPYDYEIFGNIHNHVSSAIATGGSFILTYQEDNTYLDFNPLDLLGPTGWAMVKGLTNTDGNYPTLTITTAPATVPVPSAFALMFSGIGLLGLAQRRRKGMCS